MLTPYKTVPVTIMQNAATMIVKNDPSAVSTFPHMISFSLTFLSTTALCWKKIIHGAIVVPILAMIRKNNWLLKPPGGRCGTKLLYKTSETDGWTKNAQGIYTRLTAQNPMAIFSH